MAHNLDCSYRKFLWNPILFWISDGYAHIKITCEKAYGSVLLYKLKYYINAIIMGKA